MLQQILAIQVGRGVDKAVLLFMAIKADHDGTAAPTWRDLEDGIEFDRKSIMGAIRRMRSLGFLTDTGRRCGATGRVVVYQINPNPKRECDDGHTASDKTGHLSNDTLTTEPPPISPTKDPFNEAETGPIGGGGMVPFQDLLPASRSTENLSSLLKESKNLYILPTSVPTENPIQSTDARETKPADLLFIYPTEPVSSNAAGVTNAAGAKAKREPRRLPRHPIPDNWMPDAAGVGFAKAKGCDVEYEIAKFKAYHETKGDLAASWPAAWRTWCLNQEKWRKEAEARTRGVTAQEVARGERYQASTLRTSL